MIKPLTSLRFVFALFVFCSHVQFAVQADSPFSKSIFDAIFSEGFIGVGFFFTLSGFILSYTYEQRLRAGLVSKSAFWIARFAKIYPLHLLTFLAAIPIIYWETKSSESMSWLKGFTNLALLQSMVPIKSYYFSINYPSWSISTEAFFYLLFPGLISIFSKSNRIVWIIGSMFVLGMMLLTVNCNEQWFFYVSPLSRMVDFIIGIGIFQVYTQTGSVSRSKANILEITSVLLLLGLLWFHSSIPIRFRYAAYYWPAIALIIYAFAFQKGLLSKLLSLRFFTVLGEISFAFYMLHFLVIRLFSGLGNQHRAPSLSLNILILIISTLVLSLAVHYRIEKPLTRFIKQKAKLNSRNSNEH